ncbi:hypothetical protein [Levilactobacillus zymae]|uniref:hypothetical protein n=1 Tax=Levilactobacillus zymae TaxID=267363 RepID=UPI0028BB4807|nr:hypothetical protein [Levilactobacillus zymae]MDT6981232.1 hypothetical protein [Levilactobacillus zymae]
MLKSRLLGLTIVALGTWGLGTAMTTTTAQAAKWHAGTPKVLRGTYAMHKKDALGEKPNLKFTATKLTLQLNPPTVADHLSKVSYRKINAHTYYLKGHYLSSGVLYVKAIYSPKAQQKRLKIQEGFLDGQHIKWSPQHAMGWFYQK